jgi:hypothetical protein
MNWIGKDYCYIHLCVRYDSEESFIDEYIEVVCCSYIYRVIEHGENRLLLTKVSYMEILSRLMMQQGLRSARIGATTKIIWGIVHLLMSFISHFTHLSLS